MGKTGPKCSICSHRSRHQIEIGLAHGISHEALARRFNVSHDAIGRHAKNHVTPAMRAAILTAQAPTKIDLAELQASEQEGLLSQLVHQRARLQLLAGMAGDYGDVSAAVNAEKAITGNLALVGKLLGMIVQRHDVRSTNLLVSADYLAIRQVLVETLRPFPEAARAVGAALHRLETDAAAAITQATRPARMIEAKPAASAEIIDVTPAPPPCPVPPPC